MDKIKTVKIKNEDGSVSQEAYYISADARNIDMTNGYNVHDTIGTIDVNNNGSIAEQLNNTKNNIENLDIILKKKAYFFDTIADMKNADLQIGDCVCTLGYHKTNDGGGAEYKIIDGNYIEDGGKYHKLNNNLFAELIIKDNAINVNQFGAYGDGVHDDTSILQRIFDNTQRYDIVVFNSFSTYYLTDGIAIKLDTNLEGNNCVIQLSSNFSDYAFKYNVNDSGSAISTYPRATAFIRNFLIKGEQANFINNNGINICQHADIYNIRFEYINHCIYFSDDYIDRVNVYNISCSYRTEGTDFAIYAGNQGDCKHFHHMQELGSANRNLLKIGSNLVHVMVDNLIGSIETHSPTIFKDIMLSYYFDINIYGANCSLENIHLTKNKENRHRICVYAENTRSDVEIKNVKAYFTNENIEYIEDEEFLSSIYIDDCNSYKLENVYTGVRYQSNYHYAAQAFEVIDFNTTNVYNTIYNKNPEYWNGKIIYNRKYIDYTATYRYGSSLSFNNILKQSVPFNSDLNTTYYYALEQGIDIDSKFGSKVSSEQSIAIDNASKSPYLNLQRSSVNIQFPYRVRIFRGTSSGVYDKYADITLINEKALDNGLFINGIPWKDMDSDHQPHQENNNFIRTIQYFPAEAGTYNKIIYATHDPINNPVRFSYMSYIKGDMIIDIMDTKGIYLYDGTSWELITNSNSSST